MPKSLLETTLDNYRTLILERDADLARAMTKRYAEIERSLQAKVDALANELAKLKADNQLLTAQRLYQMERYQALLASARAELNDYAKWADQRISDEQRRLLEMGIKSGADLVDAGRLDAGLLRGAFNMLPADAVNFQIGLTQTGTPLYRLIEAAYPEMVDAVTRELVVGIAEGTPVREIARGIVAMWGQHMGMPLIRALTIARTETLRAYRAANADQMKTAGIKTYIRRCALSDRTCPACLALDGKEYPTDELFVIHPNCRCFMAPKIPGIDYSKFKTGKEWFYQLPEARQRAIVGPGKYDWLTSGGDFEKLATVKHDDTWGDTIRQAPLSQLK
jgi:SPP1 gp7 family putative phage head morphogenesis protein